MNMLLKMLDEFKWCYWSSETQLKIQTKVLQGKNDTEVFLSISMQLKCSLCIKQHAVYLNLLIWKTPKKLGAKPLNMFERNTS